MKESTVKVLLGRGAIVDAKNENGFTALDMALQKGHENVVKAFHEKVIQGLRKRNNSNIFKRVEGKNGQTGYQRLKER